MSQLDFGENLEDVDYDCLLPMMNYERREIQDSDIRISCYINFVLSEGLSENSMDRLDGMMSVINGAPPPVSLGVIKRELKLLRNKVILEMNFYCHCCGRKKKGKRDECEACLKPTSRLSDTVTMIICNVQWQLMNLLKYHGKEILYAHKRIHEGQETFHGTDVRRFSGYRCEMETKTEYQKGLINLIYTLSSDGARFKRLSKCEALKELRLGTFIIADGSSQGYFARRKRHIAKSKVHEAGEEEEES
ncbi:hypothetical protein L5515_010620 [Caenorhabditis briggsae]|uniref:Uncharacterized protein n=1 Tax=Caenorhabditis briggsae TaxID=6238 RepID=A0AAE9ESK3_CAEBR|nr:hypothetical protein L5515_010620 [Caenorhabditis briggsae]